MSAIMLDIDYFKQVNDTVAGTPIDAERGPRAITISLGVAAATAERPDLVALLNRAGAAMYAAKTADRNRAEATP